VALELSERGYRDVYALKGGFDAWKQAGLPLEAPAATDVAPS
jgi:rhodanese-related sulfurtransferase